MKTWIALLARDQDQFAICAKKVQSRLMVWMVEWFVCQMADIGYAFTFAINNGSAYKNTAKLVQKILRDGDALDVYLLTKYIPNHGLTLQQLEDIVVERDCTGEASYHIALRVPNVNTERLRRNLQIKCPQSRFLVMFNFNVFATPASGLTDLRTSESNKAKYDIPNIARIRRVKEDEKNGRKGSGKKI